MKTIYLQPNPYKSKAQQRLFHALAAKGKISSDIVAEYDRESADLDLPERVSNGIANKYDLAAELTLAGIKDNQEYKLSAKEQKEIFGYNVFNKQSIIVNYAKQHIEIRKKVIPNDILWIDFSFDDFVKVIKQHKIIKVT